MLTLVICTGAADEWLIKKERMKERTATNYTANCNELHSYLARLLSQDYFDGTTSLSKKMTT
jgi:hypothetical protein